ncbi:MAG TPA: hypothetical protein VMH86_00720 [Rhizomicrobium sp.]|nr:hypothetical protein [Rhizomicrobium sp.]
MTLFNFRRRKSVETMLAELAKLGIRLSPGIEPDELLADFSREAIEKSGFEMLLVAMGSPNASFSSDVWHFDAEAIEDHGSYVDLAEHCVRLANPDLSFVRISDHVEVDEGEAWIEYENGSGVERVILAVDDDWVDPAFFDDLDKRLESRGSKRRFWAHVLGQDSLIICQPESSIGSINRTSGLKFGSLRL